MNNDRRKRLLIVISIACVGVWGADSLILTPAFGIWQAREGRIQKLEQEVTQGAGLLEREADLKARWETMKSQALPDRVSDAETAVFQSVSRWTGESRLVVTNLKPRWSRVDRNAQTLEIQLEGAGSMEALARFLYELESDPLPLRVEDMQITAQDEKGGRLNLTLRFTGLVLEEASS